MCFAFNVVVILANFSHQNEMVVDKFTVRFCTNNILYMGFLVLQILFKRGLLKYKKNTLLEATKGLEEEGVDIKDPIFLF